VSVHGPPPLHFESLKLLNFDFNADPDPDPAFHSNADPDPYPAYHSNADLDPYPASKDNANPIRIWIHNTGSHQNAVKRIGSPDGYLFESLYSIQLN
jgi:hypothetical protein